jgi:hypothetical protein
MRKDLFKARTVTRWTIVIIPIIIIFLLMFISQYIVYLPVKSRSPMVWLFIIDLIIGKPLGYKFRQKKNVVLL